MFINSSWKTIWRLSLSSDKVRNLLGTLFALVIADGLITNFLIAQGMGRELNPFLHMLIVQGNLLMLKVVGALLVTLLLWYIYIRKDRIFH